jgi:hypothetical protein
MVARDILLAEVTGARYHVAHISSQHSVEMVAFAKARGFPGDRGSDAASSWLWRIRTWSPTTAISK